jgi:hypothetical protein
MTWLKNELVVSGLFTGEENNRPANEPINEPLNPLLLLLKIFIKVAVLTLPNS